MKRFCLLLGASGAIGSATARELAKDGWSLYLQYNRNPGKKLVLCTFFLKIHLIVYENVIVVYNMANS